MPQLYRILEIILYSLLNFVPFMFLALYPFRNNLRFSFSKTCLLVVFSTFLQIFFGVWAGFFANGNAGLISAVSTLSYFVFFFLAIRTHWGKILFTLLMLSNIANFIVICSKCIEGQFFPELALQSYRWSFSIVMIVIELVILLPLFFYN